MRATWRTLEGGCRIRAAGRAAGCAVHRRRDRPCGDDLLRGAARSRSSARRSAVTPRRRHADLRARHVGRQRPRALRRRVRLVLRRRRGRVADGRHPRRHRRRRRQRPLLRGRGARRVAVQRRPRPEALRRRAETRTACRRCRATTTSAASSPARAASGTTAGWPSPTPSSTRWQRDGTRSTTHGLRVHRHGGGRGHALDCVVIAAGAGFAASGPAFPERARATTCAEVTGDPRAGGTSPAPRYVGRQLRLHVHVAARRRGDRARDRGELPRRSAGRRP